MPSGFEQQKLKVSGEYTPQLERIVEVSKLQELAKQNTEGLPHREYVDLYNKLYEGKRWLSENLEPILTSAEQSSSEEKLDLLFKIVPLIEWRQPDLFLSLPSEKREEYEKKEKIIASRHLALQRLLDTIPNQDFSDENLDRLLTLERDFPTAKLFEIRQKVVQVIKEKPPEEGKNYLSKLNSQEVPNGFKNYGSEWVEVLSEWDPHEARPYVDELVAQIGTIKNDIGSIMSLRVVAESIQKWPSKEQRPIIEQVLTAHGFTDRYFELVKQWKPAEAKPLLRKLLALPFSPEREATYAESDYGSLAIAMSNWSIKEVEDFLNDENNTRWIREVAQIKSQEVGFHQKSYEENYARYLSSFKISTLKERSVEFDTEHIEWIAEGLKAGNTSQAVAMAIQRPELLSPEIASLMFIQNVDELSLKKVFEILSALTKEEQLTYQSAIADYLMGDDKFDIGKVCSKLYEMISQEWTKEEINQLAKELVSRDVVDIGEYKLGQTNDETKNRISALKLLRLENTITDPVLVKSVFESLIADPTSHEGVIAKELVVKIEKNKETEELKAQASRDVIVNKFQKLNRRSANDVLSIAKTHNIVLSDIEQNLPIYIKSFLTFFVIVDLENLCEFINKDYEYVSFLAKTPDEPTRITRQDISRLPLSLVEAEKIVRNGTELSKIETEEDHKKLFETLVDTFESWQDEQTISGPFQAGAEVFGYKRMLEYIKRDELSLHDALHAFREIMGLFKGSGLGEAEFYGQILQQVNMDDREYSEGTAHHHLNSIAQTINRDVGGVIKKAEGYKDIERLQELAATFDSPQAVFTSWSNLKRYSELEQLLGRTEVLKDLQKLKAEGKQALYRYVETLAFHPDSKVNMSSVIEFWRNPEHFLSAEASHTPDEIHDRKKPSNYISMPNLDLTASELRDALVEGKMDGLSVFTPLEIKYTIPVEDYVAEPLPELVNKALGSRKKGIAGVAQNPKKLFSELNTLLKSKGVKLIDYIQGKKFPEGISIPEQQIESLVYDSDFGMEKPLVKTREFVARISQKSDPEGAIAGDDTVNCMPFGDGKNTLYTFNPNTAQFVIRVVKGDGKERTIAQSVLTKDMDVKILVSNIMRNMEKENGHLHDILPVDVLFKASVYAACDNIEVAPNYSNQRYKRIIESIFRDFFREYMDRFSESEGLNPTKVPIGQGYTDALTHLPTENNTFIPQAPVSYSDKKGKKVYMLDLTKEKGLDLIVSKQVHKPEIKKKAESPLPNIKGLGYLTYEDTLKVGYLEGKAYSDNRSLTQYLFDIENSLIAKDINNAAKERPNMSLKYTDEGGKMSGYLLAWEGKLDDESVKYDADEFFGQPCVYIIDVAADGENRMAGGKLIQGFAELYKQNYLDTQNPLPIYAQAREKTSFRIIQRQLDKLAKGTGTTFELVELPTYEVGEDTMHPVVIRPVSKV